MDGLAYGTQTRSDSGNAIQAAHTPVLDLLWERCPHGMLEASGKSVGLPEGQMGNSEVGHLNIGAGRIVYQDLSRIDNAIENGSFFENEVLVEAMYKAKDNGRTVHLMGLLSDGGVHSSNEHLYALLRLARKMGTTDVAIHAFLDGRDTPPVSAVNYLKQLEDQSASIGVGRIASLMGRYWAMDRDMRWERVQQAYDALTLGAGQQYPTAEAAIKASYEAGITDEFVKPAIISFAFEPIKDGDSVIFFNFRPDRARQITEAFEDEDFEDFTREKYPQVHFVRMTSYDGSPEAFVAFPDEGLEEVLSEVLDRNGLRQLRVAETEKYAHVTYFLNGGETVPRPLEQHLLIPSPKVATYDLQPEMSAAEVGEALVDLIGMNIADVYICNFANGDMVGHTGVFDATRKAVETVDGQVGLVVDAMIDQDGVVLITADHGNAEQMIDEDGTTPFTAHTCNKVPLIVVNSGAREVKDGKLSDIAPTILGILGLPAPDVWTGTDLLVY